MRHSHFKYKSSPPHSFFKHKFPFRHKYPIEFLKTIFKNQKDEVQLIKKIVRYRSRIFKNNIQEIRKMKYKTEGLRTLKDHTINKQNG